MNCLEGIKISRNGKIEELKQQDYSGKRVYITIEDLEGNQVKSKIDLGVHNRLELEQEYKMSRKICNKRAKRSLIYTYAFLKDILCLVDMFKKVSKDPLFSAQKQRHQLHCVFPR